MSLIATARAALEPALTHTKRTPDPGKTCQAPSCDRTFFRREKEALKEYRLRRSCGGSCSRELQSLAHRASTDTSETCYAFCDPSDFACQNCVSFKEDPDMGTNCVPCTTGQNFKRK